MPSKAYETLYIQPYPITHASLGSQGNTITLAHPDEPYMQQYGRFGEAPVPRSRTCLEDAALHNLLPHLYRARLQNPHTVPDIQYCSGPSIAPVLCESEMPALL